jgi:hypothetical protein
MTERRLHISIVPVAIDDTALQNDHNPNRPLQQRFSASRKLVGYRRRYPHVYRTAMQLLLRLEGVGAASSLGKERLLGS